MESLTHRVHVCATHRRIAVRAPPLKTPKFTSYSLYLYSIIVVTRSTFLQGEKEKKRRKGNILEREEIKTVIETFYSQDA